MRKNHLLLPKINPKKNYCMTIGILKETAGENRVALLPESVVALIKMNVTILVEAGAGLNAFASDKAYEEAGASIETKAKVISAADMQSWRY